jgi:hypothetical protein
MRSASHPLRHGRGAAAKEITQSPRTIDDAADPGTELSHGTRLFAQVWMPKDASIDSVRTIFEFSPHVDRDATLPRETQPHPGSAGHDDPDPRGSCEQGGLLPEEYTPHTLQLANDMSAWPHPRPWCSGAAEMTGKSSDRSSFVQTAALRPPKLGTVAAFPSAMTRFHRDIRFRVGCLWARTFGWDVKILSNMARPAHHARRLDLRAQWLAQLDGLAFRTPRCAARQSRDDYRRQVAFCEERVATKVPLPAFGSWGDIYVNTVLRRLAAPQEVIIGSWGDRSVARPPWVGEAFNRTLALDQRAYRLAAGQVPRIVVSYTDWPFTWPTPMLPTATTSNVSLISGTVNLSIPEDSYENEWTFPSPVAAPVGRHKMLREGPSARHVRHQTIAWRRPLIIADDSGETEGHNHRLITDTHHMGGGQSTLTIHSRRYRTFRGSNVSHAATGLPARRTVQRCTRAMKISSCTQQFARLRANRISLPASMTRRCPASESRLLSSPKAAQKNGARVYQ